MSIGLRPRTAAALPQACLGDLGLARLRRPGRAGSAGGARPAPARWSPRPPPSTPPTPPRLVADRAVGEGEVALLEVAVAVEGEQQVVERDGLAAHRLPEHRADESQTSGKISGAGLPSARGCLVAPEDGPVAVVVEEDELGPPGDDHGEPRLEHDADRGAQALRPARDRAERGAAQSISRISRPISPPPARTRSMVEGSVVSAFICSTAGQGRALQSVRWDSPHQKAMVSSRRWNRSRLVD